MPTGTNGLNSMIGFTVNIQWYNAEKSTQIRIDGYQYAATDGWHSVQCNTISGEVFRVRLGWETSGYPVVMIGETTTAWSYPTVTISDVQIGYTGYSDVDYQDEWPITFGVTSLAGFTTEFDKTPHANATRLRSDDGASWLSAAEAATANTIVERTASGYVNAVYFNNSHSSATRNSDTVFYTSNDDYIRKNTASGTRTSLGLGSLATLSSVSSSELTSSTSLIIYNSAGSALKTIYGAGS